ncbi:MAG TPA: carboxypeptidase regulatory-like domain-containing protein [Candidatus Solibacter sp.]|nr:carboxypeptidase regulatory-like domain-containing protein [Candidatus Solibacter sp.]
MSRLIQRIVFALLIAAPVLAQTGLGSITGSVQDSTGGIIAGAKVRLTENATQVARTTTTNEAGIFTFPSVVVGTYSVAVAHAGFKEKKIENLAINAFQQLSLGQITMEVGQAAESVTVTATAEQALVKDSGVRFETVTAKQVTEMPLAGRNWINLLKVIPGATPTNTNALNGREYTATGYSDFKINGKAGSQTQVNLDGGSIVDQGSDAKTSVAPSLESIQEVAVLTNNFQAEYGTRGGTVINIVTKSGSNQFHSTIFDYIRNEALNANSYAQNYVGTPRSRYRFNYFGANLGGPIKKNKLFFFYNFEDFKQDIPATLAVSRTPTDLERNGDFSQTVINARLDKPTIYMPGTALSGPGIPVPGNVLPPSLINPLGKAILAMFPKQNINDNPLQNYALPVNNKQPRYANNAKVDWNVNDKTRSYVRYTFDGGTQEDRSTGANWGNLQGFTKRPRPDRALAADLTHSFGPRVVMDVLYSWNFDQVQWLPADPDGNTKTKYGLSALPTVYKPANDILPSVANTGYADFAFTRMPAIAINNEHQFSGSVSWVHGAHIIKFGGQHIRNYKDEVDSIVDGGDRGTYDFGVSASIFDTNYGPSNVLTGALARFQQVQNIKKKNAIYTDINLFVQDTWKVRPNLTLDYGVRFYHIPTQHELRPSETLDAVFLPSQYDPAKAPRYYTFDSTNTSAVIDPANPSVKYTGAAATILQWTIVPGSGNLLNGVVPLGTPGVGVPGVRNPKWLLFAPRGGFAWSPGGPNGKTVIRGGFGWSYNRINISDAINNFENNLSPAVDYRQTSLSTLSASTGLAPISAKSYAVRDEASNKIPTVYDYSVSVQREIPWGTILDVAYIGNLQRHQSITFNINAIPLGAAFNPKYVRPGVAGFNFAGGVSASNSGALAGSNTVDNLLMRPYQGFNTLNMLVNAGNFAYNSLQISANKRFSHGLVFQAAYTLSKLESGTESVGLYNYNWKSYTGGLAGGDGGDRRHVFTLNWTYDIPSIAPRLHFDNVIGKTIFGGWRMGHLFTWVSGQRTNPTLSSIQQSGTTSNVSNLNTLFLGTPDLNPRLLTSGDVTANSNFAHLFDTSKLAVPGIYPSYDGTGPRNYVQRPGTFANDMTLTKAFHIKERHAFELRAAFYNVFNQVRRNNLNTGVQYKANGKTFADGFSVFNSPEVLAQRNSTLTGQALYNQIRSAAGYTNVTDVYPMRVIEIGLKYRF